MDEKTMTAPPRPNHPDWPDSDKDPYGQPNGVSGTDWPAADRPYLGLAKVEVETEVISNPRRPVAPGFEGSDSHTYKPHPLMDPAVTGGVLMLFVFVLIGLPLILLAGKWVAGMFW